MKKKIVLNSKNNLLIFSIMLLIPCLVSGILQVFGIQVGILFVLMLGFGALNANSMGLISIILMIVFPLVLYLFGRLYGGDKKTSFIFAIIITILFPFLIGKIGIAVTIISSLIILTKRRDLTPIKSIFLLLLIFSTLTISYVGINVRSNFSKQLEASKKRIEARKMKLLERHGFYKNLFEKNQKILKLQESGHFLMEGNYEAKFHYKNNVDYKSFVGREVKLELEYKEPSKMQGYFRHAEDNNGIEAVPVNIFHNGEEISFRRNH